VNRRAAGQRQRSRDQHNHFMTLSIVLWVGVLAFGRLVAYDWWTIVEGGLTGN
jgi:hypothetical protein